MRLFTGRRRYCGGLEYREKVPRDIPRHGLLSAATAVEGNVACNMAWEGVIALHTIHVLTLSNTVTRTHTRKLLLYKWN